jgi:D-arabinose 1-dehydrogenase-like Zn-dependent alcohol dehydrogenase
MRPSATGFKARLCMRWRFMTSSGRQSCRSIDGAFTGDSATGDATLIFRSLAGGAAVTETMPLEEAPVAFLRMMSGKARFRIVLTVGA